MDSFNHQSASIYTYFHLQESASILWMVLIVRRMLHVDTFTCKKLSASDGQH